MSLFPLASLQEMVPRLFLHTLMEWDPCWEKRRKEKDLKWDFPLLAIFLDRFILARYCTEEFNFSGWNACCDLLLHNTAI